MMVLIFSPIIPAFWLYGRFPDWKPAILLLAVIAISLLGAIQAPFTNVYSVRKELDPDANEAAE